MRHKNRGIGHKETLSRIEKRDYESFEKAFRQVYHALGHYGKHHGPEYRTELRKKYDILTHLAERSEDERVKKLPKKYPWKDE